MEMTQSEQNKKYRYPTRQFNYNIYQELKNIENDINNIYEGCALRMMSVDNDNEQQNIIKEFKFEFESKKQECAVLIVNSASAPDKWKIAGFDDRGRFFNEQLIDDPCDELLVELKKESLNENKIVKLVTSRLGRTLYGIEEIASFETHHLFQEFLDMSASAQFKKCLQKCEQMNKEKWQIEAKKIVSYYRRLITIRTALTEKSEVHWGAPPNKLLLFFVIMDYTGFARSYNESIVRKMLDGPIGSTLKSFLGSESMSTMRSSDFWDMGTPLDPSLRGSGLKEKINQWLRADW